MNHLVIDEIITNSKNMADNTLSIGRNYDNNLHQGARTKVKSPRNDDVTLC